MEELNLTKEFFIHSILSMVGVVIIIKFITAYIESSSKRFQNDEIFAEKVRLIYDLFPLLGGIFLAFLFFPENSSLKLMIFYIIYFVGGILVLYKYLFKHIISALENIIERKGKSL